MRELRRHLERYEPVVAAGLAVHVGEHVGGHLDVLHGDPLVYRERSGRVNGLIGTAQIN